MSYPQTLENLTAREAISDAMYRALLGFDYNDVAIFNSAFAGEDVVLEINSGPGEDVSVQGLSSIRTQFLAHVGPMDTTHMTSNVRVSFKEGESTASLTANFLAQHCPPGRGKELDGPKFMASGQYSIDLVHDNADGMWKIKKWVLNIIWRQGDISVMHRSA
ncbi:hypothetical protein N7462_004136 [Penicillium macrosclerotiorum]|uniref:uncharacterized protein n=1 Tax=Penicillium macrosclerotiorum TaxID=303699 RepID=UPI002547C5E1|nr:uncharacterized protein N7462_004136 [Penicillium macrosclerotiorum]KAJ5689744.1 hypothetical protein N7462_004136 [Penicillium macrosclerotiorum]